MIIERLARLGYASVGTVYLIMGMLAAAAGLGRGGTTDHEGVIEYLLDKPFGKPLLVVMIFGLIGYSLWLLASGFTDSDSRGSKPKGIAIRIGATARGLVYAAFIIEIIRLLTHGQSSEGSEQKADHWTARLMEQPFGRTMVAAVGLTIVGYGAYQLYRAWESKLSKRLHLGEMKASTERKVIAISRFGIGARGIVFLVVGGSLLIAALRHNPSSVHGTRAALGEMPAPMLIAVGIGFMAYGIYAFANARYRSIST